MVGMGVGEEDGVEAAQPLSQRLIAQVRGRIYEDIAAAVPYQK